MKSYYVKCKKDTANIDPKIVRMENSRVNMPAICSVCGYEKSRFVKEQEAKCLLNNLEIKRLLNKIS